MSEKTCKKKTARGNVFDEVSGAKIYLAELLQKVSSDEASRLSCYQCFWCKKYHVGKSPIRPKLVELLTSPTPKLLTPSVLASLIEIVGQTGPVNFKTLTAELLRREYKVSEIELRLFIRHNRYQLRSVLHKIVEVKLGMLGL